MRCFSHFFKFLFYIEVQLLNNVLLVSNVQPSDSVIHIYVSIFFKFFFHSRYYILLSGVPYGI